jgi:hypothetical protein
MDASDKISGRKGGLVSDLLLRIQSSIRAFEKRHGLANGARFGASARREENGAV